MFQLWVLMLKFLSCVRFSTLSVTKMSVHYCDVSLRNMYSQFTTLNGLNFCHTFIISFNDLLSNWVSSPIMWNHAVAVKYNLNEDLHFRKRSTYLMVCLCTFIILLFSDLNLANSSPSFAYVITTTSTTCIYFLNYLIFFLTLTGAEKF